MLNLKNTLDGYLKNIEVIGNTIQDTNNLANIRSVGDKVEGQELYKIDVVSCGKNLFNPNDKAEITDWGDNVRCIAVNPNTYYSYQSNPYESYISIYYYTKDMKHIGQDTIKSGGNFITPSECYYIKAHTAVNSIVQFEEGTVVTPYEPYQEQKLEILSPVQLEKVGDVADRIIYKDGVWGVEKNIGNLLLDGSEIWNHDTSQQNNTTTLFSTTILRSSARGETKVICDKFPYSGANWGVSNEKESLYINNNSYTYIRVSKDRLNTLDSTGFKSWLSENNVVLKYQLTQPQFIPLPHDQQVKLRTFVGQTNIAFLTEIPGQIKAQVPKSLGATVNTHTEQIADLHNSLDRVKKLEETTVSTVETEGSFTTVNETSNGYFEDVKLEGKTLVNLINFNKTLEATTWNHFIKTSDLNRMLKHNTEYTIVAYVQGLSDNKRFILQSTDSYGLFNNTRIDIRGNGTWVLKATTKADFTGMTDVIFTAHDPSGNIGTYTLSLCLLEGDHTNNPPSYFEGLMSVGQDVEEVSVESVNENLFDLNVSKLDIPSSVYNLELHENNSMKWFINSWNDWKIIHKLKVRQNTEYHFKAKKMSNCNLQVKDGLSREVLCTIDNIANPTRKFVTKSNDIFIEYRANNINTLCELENISICVDSNSETPHKTNKKPLLYYNPTTETWEKPILREWDTIEKHSDGKYYYHKRSEEVVLNGSESCSLITTTNQNDTIAFNVAIKASSVSMIINKNNFICDRFTFKDVYLNDINLEGVNVHLNYVRLSILKSKLSTQDVAGFKAWLKANPTTVVYELAQEEVYECTNIDLMTYSGETNYIINSGAISPKSLLKVHNNISNVVKILQEKVSLLENTFIAGLRSVLSGDMYSLATILYPEDFEQNDNTEQDIMVIPE